MQTNRVRGFIYGIFIILLSYTSAGPEAFVPVNNVQWQYHYQTFIEQAHCPMSNFVDKMFSFVKLNCVWEY